MSPWVPLIDLTSYWATQLQKLAAKTENEKQLWDEEKQLLDMINDMQDNVVCFVAGGEQVHVAQQTLTAHPDNMLAAWRVGNIWQLQDEDLVNEHASIPEVSSTCFREIVTWLRCDQEQWNYQHEWPAPTLWAQLQVAARYLGFTSLEFDMRARLQQYQNKCETYRWDVRSVELTTLCNGGRTVLAKPSDEFLMAGFVASETTISKPGETLSFCVSFTDLRLEVGFVCEHTLHSWQQDRWWAGSSNACVCAKHFASVNRKQQDAGVLTVTYEPETYSSWQTMHTTKFVHVTLMRDMQGNCIMELRNPLARLNNPVVARKSFKIPSDVHLHPCCLLGSGNVSLVMDPFTHNGCGPLRGKDIVATPSADSDLCCWE